MGLFDPSGNRDPFRNRNPYSYSNQDPYADQDPYGRGRGGGQGPYGGSPGSGLKWRLIMALGIAIVGLFMYWSQVQENPVTGEKQHVSLSPDQEISLGLQSAPQMAYEMGGELPESDPRAQQVSKVGQYLVQHSIAKNSPWQFKFHLLADDQTVNAFALPGGQIFITLGLYKKLQNEAELAGVLGHEMGHVIERHTAEQLATKQLGQFLTIAFGTGVGGSGGSMDPTQIARMVDQIIQLRYSRQDESEADIWGLKLLAQGGFDPKSLIKVMQVLKESSGGGSGQVPEIFQTHPDPDLRIEQIKEYLKTHPLLTEKNAEKNNEEMQLEGAW